MSPPTARERLRVAVRGAVQGVGFRPFIYRLAHDLGLTGWVANSPQGVIIEWEGDPTRLREALLRITRDRPAHAEIHGLEPTWLDAVSYTGFEIRESDDSGEPTALVLPDIATCKDCLADIFDPANRRYRYPFTNCTNCGPRFTIIERLPYDRPNTSMRMFAMCPACRAEYDDPRDRRFHAQPNACPVCGPQLALWDVAGHAIAGADRVFGVAVGALRAGLIVAVKGIGGFQLLVDATNPRAVARLRRLKGREEKPFAVMYPTLRDITDDATVSDVEASLLASAEAPIVLVSRRRDSGSRLAAEVAPNNPYLGVMVPYTPMHHVLLADFGGPVVATSGNLSEEPICIDEHEALDRLRAIADYFLVHNRRIVRHADDSVVRVIMGRELVTRRARGYAPLPVRISHNVPPMIAVGGHLKNTVAIATGSNVFLTQHIGDLESPQSIAAFRATLDSVQALYHVTPELVAADAHPDYISTKHAQSLAAPVVQVQHHFAHVASCMAENDLQGRVLGVAWDGTGYGDDGTIWGGEFLLTDGASYTRVAALRSFRLPGGDRAIREPRRSALGLLYAILGDALSATNLLADAFAPHERRLLLSALSRGINSPITTSAGRLFDAVAALIGLRQRASFEGQAALELEFAIDDGAPGRYPFSLLAGERFVVDWEPTIGAILSDMMKDAPLGAIAARFHRTLVSMIVTVARRIGEERIVLTGGCFQNRALTEGAVDGLRSAGFRPYWHQRVPPNDGGLALGQIVAAHQRSLVPCALPSQAESSRSTATTPSCAPDEWTLRAS